ncbi:MAG: multidrug efflux SMR transporter [Chloroflexales bacterium]|nr:multidrug efflux SMR transporter [Chloroflexales bacterium]
MAWLILLLAGLFEIGFTTSLKLSHNFSELWPSLAFLLCAGLSFGLLSRALKTIPLGTAYAVWSSIGAIGTVLVGIAFFSEPASFARIALLVVMIGAVVGLKLIDEGKAPAPVAPAPIERSQSSV